MTITGKRRVGPVGAAVGLAAVVLAVASGCTGSATANSGSMSSSSSSSSSSAEGTAAPAAAGNAAQSGADAASGPNAGTGNALAGKPKPGEAVAPAVHSVVYTASVSLRIDVAATGRGDEADQAAEAKAVNQAAVRVRALAGPDGYVSASEGSGDTVSITLRVPPTGYRQVLTGLAGLGTVTQQTEKAQDVTGALVDLTSRMETMKASVARVRLLLSRADKVGDVIAIESELTKREADLESLERQQAALAGQVALSTVTVAVTAQVGGTEPPPVAAARTGFLGGLSSGWHALTGFLGGVAVLLGTLLPFLPFAAVVAVVWVLLARRQRRLTTIRSTRVAGGPRDAD